MATQSIPTYSLGSLAGPVPFARVIRSIIKTLEDEDAQVSQVRGTVFLDDRNSPEAISRFIQHITDVAQRWTQKRIEYLDAVQGSISHRDARLFDHDLIRCMLNSKTYADMISILNGCENGQRLQYQRE